MKKNKIITLGVLIMSTTVFSGTEIDALKDRITKLENNATKVEISGEVSVNFTKGNQDDEAEIGIATSIAAGFNSNIVFSGTDQLTADEITIGGNVKGIDFIIGKQTAPFGVYETAMISDPTGSDIGDTDVKALVLSKQIKNVTLTAWSGNNGNSGFGLGYKGDNFAVGVETIRDALADDKTPEFKNKGVSIHGQVSFKNFTVIVEQVTTSGDTAAEIKHKERQLEAQYATGNWVFAIRIDGGDTKSNAAAVSYTIAEGVSLVVEGNKPKDGDSATLAKLTYEF
jgi:hypothetical protein